MNAFEKTQKSKKEGNKNESYQKLLALYMKTSTQCNLQSKNNIDKIKPDQWSLHKFGKFTYLILHVFHVKFMASIPFQIDQVVL